MLMLMVCIHYQNKKDNIISKCSVITRQASKMRIFKVYNNDKLKILSHKTTYLFSICNSIKDIHDIHTACLLLWMY